jgi:hypothetical protein
MAAETNREGGNLRRAAHNPAFYRARFVPERADIGGLQRSLVDSASDGQAGPARTGRGPSPARVRAVKGRARSVPDGAVNRSEQRSLAAKLIGLPSWEQAGSGDGRNDLLSSRSCAPDDAADWTGGPPRETG